MLKRLFRLFNAPRPCDRHDAAEGWMVKPSDYAGAYCVTASWQDLPETCYDCGTKTVETRSDPLMIDGEIQYMTVTRSCPKGCGRTDWMA